MWSSSRSIAAPAVIAVAFLAPAASADPSDADKEQAKVLYVEGMELREQGKKKEALEKFVAAYKLVPSPITGLAVAVAYEDTGDLLKAQAAYDAVATLPPKPTESHEARTARSQATKLGEGIRTRIPRLRVRVLGLPTSAAIDVQLDGNVVDVSTEIRTNPGTHHLVVNAASYGSRSRDFAVGQAEQKTIELSFEGESLPAKKDGATPRGSTTTTNPLVYWGVGLTALGAGIGVLAYTRYSSLNDRVEARCGQAPPDGCSPDVLSERTSWKGALYFVALPVFMTGAALTTYGLASPVADRRHAARSVYVVIRPTGVGLFGHF